MRAIALNVRPVKPRVDFISAVVFSAMRILLFDKVVLTSVMPSKITLRD
jgi:hypothetical protein